MLRFRVHHLPFTLLILAIIKECSCFHATLIPEMMRQNTPYDHCVCVCVMWWNVEQTKAHSILFHPYYYVFFYNLLLLLSAAVSYLLLSNKLNE